MTRTSTTHTLLATAVAALALVGGTVATVSAQPKKPKPAPAPAPAPGGDDDEIEMEGDDGDTTPPAGDTGDEIEMEGDEPTDAGDGQSLEADLANVESDAIKADTDRTVRPVSWGDIVVVMRKPFLKLKRVELMPFLATTMNDNMIRHYAGGGALDYFLTDVLAVGVEGQYFAKQFREPFDLVGRQARRLPTINKYNFAGALNFHYVPVYGKFAILDKKLVHWEAYFTAGVGVTQTEVVPRDPRFPGFTNLNITPNVGASMRFFLTKWATVNVGIRDYIMVDKFEPTDRSPTMNASAAQAKENAEGTLINNVMFQLGVSFWIPPTFEYSTFR
jgi:outer membrane beta-barrel protein